MLVVEQNVQSALAVADRVYVMSRGCIVHQGPADGAARRCRASGSSCSESDAVTAPLLRVEGLVKRYTRGLVRPRDTFTLEADFTVDGPGIVGVMGPNGSGKTTLFELITGSNRPTRRPGARGRAGHPRGALRRARPARDPLPPVVPGARVPAHPARRRCMEKAHCAAPRVHLFDEPQFNTQDGYIGFMLDFFRKLRAEGRLVFLCLHPNEPYHLQILRESCERFLFVNQGQLMQAASFDALVADPGVRSYLGALAPPVAGADN